jgi:dTDP-4-dehydrorhamnose reductase
MASTPRLLIVGGSGFIGGRLVQTAMRSGFHTAYTYHRQPASLAAPAYQVDLADLDVAGLDRCLAAEQPGALVYCAVPHGQGEQAHWRVSVDGVQRCLSLLARHAPAALFVYLSTNAVFAGTHDPHREDTTPDAALRRDRYRTYGMARALGEQASRELWPNSLVVGTSTVDGYTYTGDLSTRFSGWLNLLESGQPFKRFADRQISPTLVDNLVEALLEVLHPAFAYRGILHIAGSEQITDYAYACLVAAHAGASQQLIRPESLVDSPLAGDGPQNTSLDTTFTQSLLCTRLLNVIEQLQILLQKR